MARIENTGAEGAASFLEQIQSMPDDQLLAQSLVQQGAIHAISTLLTVGCTEHRATDMLRSLREQAQRIRDESARRGQMEPFPNDQTGTGEREGD